MKYYAGIGSRETPDEIQLLMTQISTKLETNGWICRSGGADGADKAFEVGVMNQQMKQIYLPWKQFNQNNSPLYDVSKEAMELASQFHPNWAKLSDPIKRLMGRNTYQVLGQDLQTQSKFIICWTSDGKDSGGTGQALRIARNFNIPIFNLYNSEAQDRLKKYIG